MFVVETYKDKAYRTQGRAKRSLQAAVDVFHAASRDAEPALWRLVEKDAAGKLVRIVKKFDLRGKSKSAGRPSPDGFMAVKNGSKLHKNLEAQATPGQL